MGCETGNQCGLLSPCCYLHRKLWPPEELFSTNSWLQMSRKAPETCFSAQFRSPYTQGFDSALTLSFKCHFLVYFITDCFYFTDYFNTTNLSHTSSVFLFALIENISLHSTIHSTIFDFMLLFFFISWPLYSIYDYFLYIKFI